MSSLASTASLASARAAVARLAPQMTAAGLRLATAESCTGGLIGMLLTEQPGSSEFYLGGVVAYANQAKEILLGVPAATLARHGAVSAATARAMAQGARERLAADLAVSVTGIAGPGGTSPARPGGLVYIGLATARVTRARRYHFDGDRATVRAAAAVAALEMVLAALRRPQSDRAA